MSMLYLSNIDATGLILQSIGILAHLIQTQSGHNGTFGVSMRLTILYCGNENSLENTLIIFFFYIKENRKTYKYLWAK